MKNKIYITVSVSLCFLICIKINAQNKPAASQYANTTLSNLTSPTAIKISVLPDKDDAHNLGNSDKAWRSLYLDSVLYLHGKPFIRISSATSWNTIVGINAMHDEPLSYGNTALGYEVLYTNTTGAENTAAGALAMIHNTTGYSNVGLGYDALNQNTSGHFNTAAGFYSMFFDTSGSYNTAYGYYTLYSNTTGYQNTAAGEEALFSNTTGYYNTAYGISAGYNITDGSSNTFIGSYSNCGSGGHLANSTAIGYNTSVTTNNTVRVGNSSVTSIGGYVNWSNISDGRVKKNIKQNVPGLAFINKLNPITYNLDLYQADKIIGKPLIKDKDGKSIQSSTNEITARKEKEQIVYTGFIAQDVEKSAKELNYDFSGVDKPDNANTLYGLRYGDFVVPLVKAVQELSKQNDSLKNENENLEERVSKLESFMNANNQSVVNDQQSTVVSSASLLQNIPNPFSNTTTIRYVLPKPFTSAKIIITDKNGNALKEINLSSNKGSVSIDASTLASGTYQYSLYIDGKLIDIKQMILSK